MVKEVNTHRLSSTKFMIRPPPTHSFNTIKPRQIDRSWGIHIYQKVWTVKYELLCKKNVCTEYHKVCTKLETKHLIRNDKCVPIIIKCVLILIKCKPIIFAPLTFYTRKIIVGTRKNTIKSNIELSKRLQKKSPYTNETIITHWHASLN